MTGVNHQPLKVWVVGNRFQQLLPGAIVPPAGIAAMGVLPVAVVRGKSRQGAPVRKIQNTALRKRRLSWAGRPTLPLPPGKSGSRIFQTRSEMSCRRCDADDAMLIPAVGFLMATIYHSFPI